jgi:TM2 domain-containing membrane protein YozV
VSTTPSSAAAVQDNPYSAPAAIDLRDPFLAAFLAWLIPGAGHFYQRRWGKGGLFMVCILGTFFLGLWIGEGRVVYASWRPNDQRYPYICQLGVGLPSLPALVQSWRMKADPPKAPLWGGLMAPPLQLGQEVPRAWAQAQVAAGNFDADDFPDLRHNEPADYVGYLRSANDEESQKATAVTNPRDPYTQLSDWNNKMGSRFELGTIYTVIAGLLNILAIYDAWGGPVLALGRRPTKDDEK